MSHAQDQDDEVSALEAIYGEAFDRGSGGADGLSISIQPSLGGVGARAWVSCRLRCRYTPEYPDAPADLSLESISGLTEAQASELRGEMLAAALENAGTPYVFAVAERVREWLTAHNEKPSDGSAFDDMVRRARAKEAPALASTAFSREDDPSIKRRVVISAAEEDTAEKRKRDGTPVTPESFSAWLAAFQAETAEQARAEEAAISILAGGKPASKVERCQLTGRQLFESGGMKEEDPAATVSPDGEDEDVDVKRLLANKQGFAPEDEGEAAGGGVESDDDDDDESYDEDDDGDD